MIHSPLSGLNALQHRIIDLCRSMAADEKAFVNAKDLLRDLACFDFDMDEDDFEDECEALNAMVAPLEAYEPESVGHAYRLILQMGLPWRCRYPHFDLKGMVGDIHDEMPFGPESVELRLSRSTACILQTKNPPLLPMFLLNGQALPDGSEVPPHNLEELWLAIEHLRQDPEIALEDLMEVLPGPDFPACGIVGGIEAIRSLYQEGQGILTLRGEIRSEIEGGRTRIAVTSLPQGVLVKTVLEQIRVLSRQEAFPLYVLKNASEGQAVRIVLDVSPQWSATELRTLLYRETDLEKKRLFCCSPSGGSLIKVLKRTARECPPAWVRKDGRSTDYMPFLRDALKHGGYINPLTKLIDTRRTRILQMEGVAHRDYGT